MTIEEKLARVQELLSARDKIDKELESLSQDLRQAKSNLEAALSQVTKPVTRG